MAGDGDLRAHATGSEDLYGVLEVSPSANESEIRRAYRRAALKYHPDKVGANEDALEKFHRLQIAHDILSDPELRQLHDSVRRAQEEKQARVAALDGRRRQLVEELQKREREGNTQRKRKAGEVDDEQQKEDRIAEDGRRRRREWKAKVLRKQQEEEERYRNERLGLDTSSPVTQEKREQSQNEDLKPNPANPESEKATYRSVIIWFPKGMFDRSNLASLFERFGKIENVVLSSKTKKKKIEGEQHRREFSRALIEFQGVVGARAAVTDWPDLAKSDIGQTSWSAFEEVRRCAEEEPTDLPESAMSDSAHCTTKHSILDPPAGGANYQTESSHGSLMKRLKDIDRMKQARKLQKEEASATAEKTTSDTAS